MKRLSNQQITFIADTVLAQVAACLNDGEHTNETYLAAADALLRLISNLVSCHSGLLVYAERNL